MFCRKCGFEMDDNAKECPFCNSPIEKEPYKYRLDKERNSEEVITSIYDKTETIEVSSINEDVSHQEYVNINEEEQMGSLRNSLGYVNLKTQAWHHILLAGVGYLLMNIILLFIGRTLVSNLVAKGFDFSCIKEDMTSCSPDVLLEYTKVSCIAQVSAEIIVIIATSAIFFKYLKTFFSEFKIGRTWKWVGIGFGLMYGLTFIYSIILQVLELTSTSTNQDAVNETIFANPLLGFLFVVIAAPLFEEIIFRLGIFRAFTGKGKKLEIVGIVVTTLLFAFIHMSATIETVFADINNPDWELFRSDMLSLPSYLIGAFSLTFAYYKSKNLLTPMLMHMAWNFMAFIGIIGQSVIDPSQSTEVIMNLIETLTRLF